MNTQICPSNHYNNPAFEALNEDQGYPARHKCCGCAYEQGLKDGKARAPKKPYIDSWFISQAGTGRHKSALEAYELGYATGMRHD